MKFYLLFRNLLLVCIFSSLISSVKGQNNGFVKNVGQVHDQLGNQNTDVRYTFQGSDMLVHLMNNGVNYQFYELDSLKSDSLNKLYTVRRLESRFHSTNPSYLFQEEGVNTNDTLNYVVSAEANGTKSTFACQKLLAKDVYNGVDYLWEFTEQNDVKYTINVPANFDLSLIATEYTGADSLVVDQDGNLRIYVANHLLIDERPFAVQDGKTSWGNWRVSGNLVRYAFQGIDYSKPYLIDPIVRLWGTYYGATVDGEQVYKTVLDPSGTAVYLLSEGKNASLATSGAYLSTATVTSVPILAKFNDCGVRQWATFFGVPAAAAGVPIRAFSASISSVGSVTIVGFVDGPIGGVGTVGAHQTSFPGGNSDGFLATFSASGALLWSTYYGGSNDTFIYGVCHDPSDNIYAVGYTESAGANKISTAGSHQVSFGGGSVDAFIVKFNSMGVRQWGTYYGGTLDDFFYAVSASNNDVYVCGNSGSTNAISTAGAHQTGNGGGAYDGIVVKFNTAGVRQWGTFYGGTAVDVASSCILDGASVYVGGYTLSANAISTAGTHQTVIGGAEDVFIVKFNISGVRQWATYYGGTGSETGGIGAVINSVIYAFGSTTSSSAIVSATCPYKSTKSGTYDAFFALFTTANGTNIYGTYYGGFSNDYGADVAVDNADNIYLGLSSSSPSTIASITGAHQSAFGGGIDGALVKFANLPPLSYTFDAVTTCLNGSFTPPEYSIPSACSFNSYVATTGNRNWNFGDPSSGAANTATVAGNSTSAVAHTFTASGTYSVTVTFSECGATQTVTIPVTVVDCPLPVELSHFDVVPQQRNALCNWVTETELNNDYFNVQRSPNAIDFETIGKVEGSGTTTNQSEYQFLDTDPFMGVSYYRLQQVDVDGQFTYSPIRSFNLESEQAIFPNPSSGIVTIQLEQSSLKEATEILVYDHLGRLVENRDINQQIEQAYVLDLSHLKSGVYTIVVGKQNHRFVLMK